jgi:hypothetical protein
VYSGGFAGMVPGAPGFAGKFNRAAKAAASKLTLFRQKHFL